MTKSDLLNQIKNLRDLNNLTQNEIADMLGIHSRSYQRIENGECDIKVYQLLDILDILDPDFREYILSYFKNNSNY